MDMVEVVPCAPFTTVKTNNFCSVPPKILYEFVKDILSISSLKSFDQA